MKRSPGPLLKVDPALIVHKRLPWQVRKNQLRQRFWDEEVKKSSSKTPSIVVEVSQTARRKRRDPQLWNNLLDQALAAHAELAPQDMASILWSMADARFHHKALVEEFIRSLSFRAGVKSLVTAMLALDRLGLPADSLRAPFLQHLSGQCNDLSFGDLRRVLMALARCTSSVQSEQLREICDAIHEKAEECDPRDLVAVPQHLGRLRFLHPQLMARSIDAISRLISSRLSVAPLDVLRALDGLLMLASLVEGEIHDQLKHLATKCKLLSSRMLQEGSTPDLWSIGSQLLGSEIVNAEVWTLWLAEASDRRLQQHPAESRSQRISRIRRQMMKQWNFSQSLPEELEIVVCGSCHGLESMAESSTKPCIVLPGLYGLLVQLLLFACCIGTLIAKKVVEGGERTWFQFGLDSSKQLIGAGWIHILNLLCAELLGSQMGQGDECEWYWLNIILDTTLGVLIEYLLLRVLTDALNTVLEEGAQDFRTGSYWRGGEFQVIMYAKQLGLWLVIVTFMKLFMVILMILLAKPLTIAAGVCLKPFMDPLLKLLVVMIATPIIMNAFQLWVTDNFIKKREYADQGDNFSRGSVTSLLVGDGTRASQSSQSSPLDAVSGSNSEMAAAPAEIQGSK
ncbi:unnamed protein product [Cladocopium goreaui]|uniref:FAST kinase leucine-rich domain-containing protein n=1 Tax=Cladocopium goreaui TaxID=2562237 RepID=A0A9P1GR19_9DINO|nr:unnamed protein product [Cladocopium goreaui]